MTHSEKLQPYAAPMLVNQTFGFRILTKENNLYTMQGKLSIPIDMTVIEHSNLLLMTWRQQYKQDSHRSLQQEP